MDKREKHKSKKGRWCVNRGTDSRGDRIRKDLIVLGDPQYPHPMGVLHYFLTLMMVGWVRSSHFAFETTNDYNYPTRLSRSLLTTSVIPYITDHTTESGPSFGGSLIVVHAVDRD